MKVEVLGMGCSRCEKLYETVRKVAGKLEIDIEITKVDKITDIMNYGVMSMPALVVDGDVKVSGRIPSKDEIKKWISEKKS